MTKRDLREKHNKKVREWRASHRDLLRERRRIAYEKDPETFRRYSRAYRKAHKRKAEEYRKKYYRENPEICRAASRRWNAAMREEMFRQYGRECECCGEDNREFLTLDHVNGGGHAERRKLGNAILSRLRKAGWPKNGYRILCMNCNFATRFGNECPHQSLLASRVA